MKRKITCHLYGDQYLYTVQSKRHWWNRWEYRCNGNYPKLFELFDLVETHIISLEELDRYFKADNDNVVIKL